MIPRFVRAQLFAFLAVTLVTVSYLTIDYVGLPRMLGFGQYEISADLPRGSGLYPKSLVTYRGVKVGTVEELRLSPDGVSAEMVVDNGVHIPSDVDAEVLSTSAIGEQYINLTPRASGGGAMRDGDVIPRQRTKLPVGTPQLFTNVNALIESVPKESLSRSVDEFHEAFHGSSDDLGRLLDSAMLLQDEADANTVPTLRLIERLVPVLRTQQAVSPHIHSFTQDLASFTGQLAKSDADIRAALDQGKPLTGRLNGLFRDLDSSLPVLLANMASTGEVARVYLPNIQHTLVVLPAVVEGVQAGSPPSLLQNDYPEGLLHFKTTANNPPTCTEGFEFAGKQRNPGDLGPAPLPRDSYCKVPHDDPRVVRGARNFPCPNDPDRRAADAAGCGLRFDRAPVPGPAPAPVAYQPEQGRILAPDGRFYRLDDVADDHPEPRTWQEVMLAPLAS